MVVLAEPTRTAALTIEILESRPVGTFDPFTRRRDVLPVGISEIVINGERNPAPSKRDVLVTPCGSGPELSAGDRTYSTSVSATRGQFVESRRTCRRPSAGTRHPRPWAAEQVTLDGSAAWAPARIAGLERVVTLRAVQAQPWRALTLDADTATLRSAQPSAAPCCGRRVLAENQNAVWRATLDGVALTPLVIDGWRQGWVVPGGRAGRPPA